MHYLYVTFGARGMLQNCTPYIVCKIIWISFLYISVWYIYCTTKMNSTVEYQYNEILGTSEISLL